MLVVLGTMLSTFVLFFIYTFCFGNVQPCDVGSVFDVGD